MGTRTFDFLTESLLFHQDYLDTNFEDVSESTLRRTLDEYRRFCDQNAAVLRGELAKTHLTVFPGLRRSTAFKSIAQSAFYLDQYLLDDPLYRLSIPERSMDSSMNRQIGMPPRDDIREAVSGAVRYMKRHTPFVAANYVKFLPLTQPPEPTVPIRYSETLFSDVLPKALLQFFRERVEVKALVPVSEGLRVIDEPLRPTRRICVTFGDNERSGVYVLQQTELTNYDDDTGRFECIMHIPDTPPDRSYFDAWVFQSINQTAYRCYEELMHDAVIAADLGAQYLTTTRLDFDLLQQLLPQQEAKASTSCIPIDLAIVEGVDATTLMRLRQDESAAFEAFRGSLNSRLSELRTVSGSDSLGKLAAEVVREMKGEASALTSVIRRLRKKALLDATIATCTLVSGVQSSGFTVAALAAALLHGARTWKEYRTQVRLNPAFFLWKLQKQQ